MNTTTELNQRIAEYRRSKDESPQFYYNEIEGRAQALNQVRPILENFLEERTSFTDFKQAIASFSRSESLAAQGRTEGRYWRLNVAGLFFLESLYKLAEKAGRLNNLATNLQKALVAPKSLDHATQAIETVDYSLKEIVFVAQEQDSEKLRLSSSMMLYFLSYCWSVQQQNWAVYDRQTRAELQLLGYLPAKDSQNPADNYTRFYLALNQFNNQLGLPNGWESESFLHWLARRQTLGQTLARKNKPRSFSPTAKKRRNHELEELRQVLEMRLQEEVAAGLRGVVIGDECLSFREPERAIRLEFRTDAQPGESWQLRMGAACDGLSPAALIESPGNHLFTELQGFLESRPEYAFYTNPHLAPEVPGLHSLSNEFWLLRSLNQTEALPEQLVPEWRILYPFIRKLIAPFDESYHSFIHLNEWLAQPPAEPDENTEAAFAYELPSNSSQKVAESSGTYSLEENYAVAAPTLDPIKQMAQEERRKANEVKLLRLAQYTPPPLTSEQADGIMAYVQERLLISPEKIAQVLTHLESGRNVILHGAPGCGKTRLARLIAGQMCAPEPGWTPEKEATNYTLAVATAEWSLYDVIGGLRPGLPADIEEMAAKPIEAEAETLKPSATNSIQYFFELGAVSRAALACETSLGQTGRPHYLLIDEFNRANQDRAFGQLFTLLEYRDQPLLPGERLGRLAELYIPNAFRIIGTMNSDDRNSLFEVGMALRRRFSLIEIPMPDPLLERRFLPKAVQSRLPGIPLNAEGEFEDAYMQVALNTITAFAATVRPNPNDPESKGKPLGTAFLISCLIFCAVAARFYASPAEALEDAIIADILPQLERAPTTINRTLQALENAPETSPLTRLKRVKAALARMLGVR